jgi:hypothetical protein
MDEIERKQLYRTAWKHWGSASQADMLIEEMLELAIALLKARRNGTFYTYAVSEEMSDVEICMEQFKTVMKDFKTFETEPHGNVVVSKCVYDQVDEIREMKLARLKERLLQSMTKRMSNGDE